MSMIEMAYDIVDNTAQIIEEFEKCVMSGAKAIGQKAEAHAKEICPVGTPETTGKPGYIGGTLKGSISNAVTREGNEVCVYIGTNVSYGKYVELIDRYKHNPPGRAHFLRDAASTHNDEYRSTMEDALTSGGYSGGNVNVKGGLV